MAYYLIHWDESRAGEDDEWGLYDANGAEQQTWAVDPRDPDDGDLSGLYEAMPPAVQHSGDWAFRRESGSGVPW